MAGSGKPPALEPDSPIQYFKGVGPVRAKLLERLGIHTARDLLHHYPVDYRTPAIERKLAEVSAGERVVVRGRILDVQKRKGRRGRGFLVAVLGEANARLVLTWFNAPWVGERLRVGRELIASGEVSEFRGRLQIVNPQIETQEEATQPASTGPVPRYPLTAGLKQAAMRQLVDRALDALIDEEVEPLDGATRGRFGLQERPLALRTLHHPESIEQVAEARRRLAFDEALALQLAVGIRRARLLRRTARVRLTEHTGLSSEYVKKLGFELTGAQRKVLSAVARDLRARVCDAPPGAGRCR